MCCGLVDMGMTLVPCWIPHRNTTCKSTSHTQDISNPVREHTAVCLTQRQWCFTHGHHWRCDATIPSLDHPAHRHTRLCSSQQASVTLASPLLVSNPAHSHINFDTYPVRTPHCPQFSAMLGYAGIHFPRSDHAIAFELSLGAPLVGCPPSRTKVRKQT